MTENDVRKDLKAIKYYYARQKELDIACKSIGQDEIIKLVDKYSVALKTASPELLDVYVGLYINGFTQIEFAEELGLEPVTIYRRNKKLLLFLVEKLNK